MRYKNLNSDEKEKLQELFEVFDFIWAPIIITDKWETNPLICQVRLRKDLDQRQNWLTPSGGRIYVSYFHARSRG